MSAVGLLLEGAPDCQSQRSKHGFWWLCRLQVCISLAIFRGLILESCACGQSEHLAMNGKKRKAKKSAESRQQVKRSRDQLQKQILSKARPFIGTKTDDESREEQPSVCPTDGLKKPPKRQKQPNAKKVKKIKAKGSATPQVPPEEQKERALGYLEAWHCKAEGWKFSKKRQSWLIRNSYLAKEVSDEDFSTMLEYLDTLTGPSREQVVTQAEGIFRECEAKMDESGSETPESCKVSYDRARQVLQML